MPETLRAYVERMARFTTIEDEFTAETEDGEALRERYEDADEYRADLDDDRLCGELNTLEEMIRDARELLAQPDAPDAAPAAPQTPDASALMLEALRLAAERIEINNYGGEEDEHLAVIRAAIATGEA